MFARLLGHESGWDAIRMRLPPGVSGPGSRRPFADYFAGESAVFAGCASDAHNRPRSSDPINAV